MSYVLILCFFDVGCKFVAAGDILVSAFPGTGGSGTKGSGTKGFIIRLLNAFGGSGGFSPLVFPKEFFSRDISFLASFRIALHFSFTSVTLLLATLSALILARMLSQTACFLLLVKVDENFSLIISKFSSANFFSHSFIRLHFVFSRLIET